jgi:hypothetical protein
MRELVPSPRRNIAPTRLLVSHPADPHERAADRIADKVTSASHHVVRTWPSQSPGEPPRETAETPASVAKVLAGPGRPLDDATRQDMQRRFGHDFSRIRIHDTALAEQSTRDMDAKAFTVGNAIVFGAGRYAPGVPGGDITKFEDRWKWLEKDMIPAFEKLDRKSLERLVNKSLDELANQQF